MEKKSFTANLNQLPSMLKWVRDALQKISLEKPVITKIELACEEALVNIISYAYQAQEGKIDIQIDLNENQVSISIIDTGMFFNPLLEDRSVDKNLPLEKREAGGLGILMIKQVMDEVHYKREKDQNILKLVKKFY